MADQASLRGAGPRPTVGGINGKSAADGRSAGGANGNANGNGSGVVGSVAELGNNVLTLAELQTRLAAADLKACVNDALFPLAVIAGAAALAVGAVPVVLLGVAELLAWALSIRPAWAMLITGLVALGVAGILVFAFLRALTGSLSVFQRSREELTRNIAWVRTVLLYSGRPVTRRND